jgi:cell division transport system permease protein
MSFVDTKRIIRSGFKNFRRSGVTSLASVLVTTITLCVILSLVFLQVILNFSLAQIKDKVDVTIYMTTSASEEKVLALKTSIEKLPEVASVNYESADDALAQFKEKYSNDYLTIQALEELKENPLGASLNVKATDPSQYESIAKFIETSIAEGAAQGIVDKVNYRQNKVVIDRLTSILEGARILGLLITLILVVISVIITFNTIRLTIFISREEIGIMRLVGAANKYIRGPFMVEGILYGVISAIATMVFFYPFSLWLGNKLSGFFGINMFEYYLGNFFQLFLIVLLCGTFLGVISSLLAVRKYLKK